jgi:hypothetical protein
MKKLNCFSCGGAVTRRGPGEYVCDFCGTVHHIDESDVRLDRAYQLDDAAISNELELLKVQIEKSQNELDRLAQKASERFMGVFIGGTVIAVELLIGAMMVKGGASLEMFGALALVLIISAIVLAVQVSLLRESNRKLAQAEQDQTRLLELERNRVRMLADAAPSPCPSSEDPSGEGSAGTEPQDSGPLPRWLRGQPR